MNAASSNRPIILKKLLVVKCNGFVTESPEKFIEKFLRKSVKGFFE